MDTVVLYLILESSTVRYVGYRVVPHTMCVYKHPETDLKYTWYVASAIYRCPSMIRF